MTANTQHDKLDYTISGRDTEECLSTEIGKP
jgi:hypothetical protein